MYAYLPDFKKNDKMYAYLLLIISENTKMSMNFYHIFLKI